VSIEVVVDERRLGSAPRAARNASSTAIAELAAEQVVTEATGCDRLVHDVHRDATPVAFDESVM
jgi:hypothetical protein